MNISIIAHGGKLIGMGHIMRTLTLATELARLKESVSFISKYEQGIDVIKKHGFHVTSISCNIQQHNVFNYGNEEELLDELYQIESIISKSKPNAIIIDSYNVDLNYFNTLRKYSECIVYIDDLNKFSYPVDILINGTICAELINYNTGLDNELMLLGLKYNLIRSEFKNIPSRVINQYVKNVMITVGGSDPHNLTERLIDLVSLEEEFENRNFHIVVTREFPYKDNVYQLANKYRNLKIYENPQRISDIMLKSDLAISAGGSTVYELLSCGVPVLVFCYAENQKPQIETMDKMGLISYLGYYNELDNNLFLKKYRNIINDYCMRSGYIQSGQKLIDCKGPERIAWAIKDYQEKIINNL